MAVIAATDQGCETDVGLPHQKVCNFIVIVVFERPNAMWQWFSWCIRAPTIFITGVLSADQPK